VRQGEEEAHLNQVSLYTSIGKSFFLPPRGDPDLVQVITMFGPSHRQGVGLVHVPANDIG
jgi:hypothetical protein